MNLTPGGMLSFNKLVSYQKKKKKKKPPKNHSREKENENITSW